MADPRTVQRLKEMYKHIPKANLRWGGESKHRDDYYPSTAGRRTCRLSPEATSFLCERHVGRSSPQATIIMIEPEGDVRRGQIQVFQDWVLCVKIALDEGSYIYNGRTKKCSRPVWSALPQNRSFDNMSFEPVRLIPHEVTLLEKLPTVRSRLFYLEE